MYFFDQKFARDEQATAGSAVGSASAELVEVASAAATIRGSRKSGEEDASLAASVRGCVTENRRLTSGQSATAVQRPLFNLDPRPAVAHP
jgi:hypothetical protein